MPSSRPTISLIAAVARNGGIGRDSQLLWAIPEDMQHFRNCTQDKTVIMGRKTWESLPERFRPLPRRRNLVITRQQTFSAPGAEVFGSLEQALAACPTDQEVFVIGGGEIYALALPLAQKLVLTEVDIAPEADAFFPKFSRNEWHETARLAVQSASGLHCAFVTYLRQVKKNHQR